MDQREGINGLFAELERSGSLHAALADGVRIACRIIGASAGSISVDTDAAAGQEEWFLYQGDAAPDNDATGRGRQQIVVPLNCGDKAAGRLNLVVPKHLSAQSVRSDLTGITAALGVLIVAAEGDICRRVPGVLGRSAFQARVHSELSRARRRDESFSLLHADVAGLKASRAGAASGPWAATSLLAALSLLPLLVAAVVSVFGLGLLFVSFFCIFSAHLAAAVSGQPRDESAYRDRSLRELFPWALAGGD